jgi:hypothetical protein
VQQQRANSGIRPGFLALVLVALAAFAVPIWLLKSRPAAEPVADAAPASSEEAAPIRMEEASAPPTSPAAAQSPVVGAAPLNPDPTFQKRVAEKTEQLYSAMAQTNLAPRPTPFDNPAIAGSQKTAPNAVGGLRGYVETDRNRQAVVRELQAMRRAAIAEANRQQTNQ